MILKLLTRLRKLKSEKRDCMLVYNKVRNKYYGVYKPWTLHEDEIILDEDMTEAEAGKAAHDLNTEVGITIHYEKERKQHVCPTCAHNLTRDSCGDYDIYFCSNCVEYMPSAYAIEM